MNIQKQNCHVYDTQPKGSTYELKIFDPNDISHISPRSSLLSLTQWGKGKKLHPLPCARPQICQNMSSFTFVAFSLLAATLAEWVRWNVDGLVKTSPSLISQAGGTTSPHWHPSTCPDKTGLAQLSSPRVFWPLQLIHPIEIPQIRA